MLSLLSVSADAYQGVPKMNMILSPDYAVSAHVAKLCVPLTKIQRIRHLFGTFRNNRTSCSRQTWRNQTDLDRFGSDLVPVLPKRGRRDGQAAETGRSEVEGRHPRRGGFMWAIRIWQLFHVEVLKLEGRSVAHRTSTHLLVGDYTPAISFGTAGRFCKFPP